MNKILVLAHPTHRFQSDFGYAGTHVVNPPCDECETNLNELSPPLLYYWDEEFGTPQVSLTQGHDCFWGGLQLMVTGNGRELLEELGLPFEFAPAKLVRASVVRDKLIVQELPSPEMGLHWARATNVADADPMQNDNDVCNKCGNFTKQVRQLTRLKLVPSDATSQGVFTVRQNHGGPIFVTEATKKILSESGLKGVGFYPAGRIID